MALVATHRQVVHRLLPQRRSSWRRLERTLEEQRQLYNAALEERNRLLPEDRRGPDILRPVQGADGVPSGHPRNGGMRGGDPARHSQAGSTRPSGTSSEG